MDFLPFGLPSLIRYSEPKECMASFTSLAWELFKKIYLTNLSVKLVPKLGPLAVSNAS